jgi:hypothetical protein
LSGASTSPGKSRFSTRRVAAQPARRVADVDPVDAGVAPLRQAALHSFGLDQVDGVLDALKAVEDGEAIKAVIDPALGQ